MTVAAAPTAAFPSSQSELKMLQNASAASRGTAYM